MKKIKIGRWIVLAIVLFVSYKSLLWSFTLPETIVLHEWDTFQSFLEPLSSWDRLRTKIASKISDVDVSKISVGTYNFTGSYKPHTYLDAIVAGPTQKFVRYTVLEWRSVYDIDADLASRGLISAGEYISYVNNYARIQELQSSYVFLQQAGDLQTLEGFLYPDTYFLDDNGPLVMQLVKVQLDTFAERVWSIYGDKVPWFMQAQWLDRYDVVTLASVVQKEERNATNQPTIAGIFLRRMSIGMRLDADITLCYYYKRPYELCDPSFIGAHITDDQPYNTRQVKWLPPTPIANVPASAVAAVFDFVPSSYLYYLHDNDGRVWWAETLEKHNSNKAQYLR